MLCSCFTKCRKEKPSEGEEEKKTRCCGRATFCMRLQERGRRHDRAMEMFDEEFDVIKIIHTLRLTEFMSSMNLKRHQRALLTNF
jgi:hypothetical protein